ncbi:phytoene/squalene synthetase [Shimia abyssi]|uniref:Phytoene/squalene synthetase n=2 Tax=Shimia abyssi TaxID=1662395 RepID=A0A2P8FG63_9RHOB|nr:phytoene/squalene synthetase [Shimia abyssi]
MASCAGIVERGDPDRFIAVMAAAPAARETLFPIYAFNVEVARAPWVTQETMIAEMRLQWWADALGEIAEGPTEERLVRRHEVITPMAAVVDATGAKVLQSLVEARRWDIYKDPFEDEAHFERYLQATAGGLMFVAARALGDVPEEVARDVGYAQGLANWLRAIPALEAEKRIPLVDGREEPVARLAASGLERLKRARSRRSAVSRAARTAFLAAWQAGAILQQAANEPQRVGAGALGQSEFARKGGLMLKAMTGRW